MLRQWDDSALCRLLMARPDLATPHPTSFSQVASRATTRGSVADALQSLHAFDLWVAGRAHTQQAWMSTDTLAQEAPEEAVAEALGRLTASALMWGDGGSVRGVRAIGALLTDAPGSPPPAQPPRFDDVRRRSPPLVDKVAAGSAFELVRRVDVLVEHCDHEPARLRRSGGLSTRDARALAGLLDVPTAIALVHLEIAQSAGLLGTVAHGHDEVLIPTAQFDSWQSLELAEQWDDTAHAWTHHHAGSGSAAMKQLCLEAFGDPREGRVLSADDLHTWLAWQRPRRPAGTDKRATTMLEQASWLGITGLGALSSFGTSTDPGTLTTLLPERVGHVLVQADLTAVAPGPLTPDAARELGTLADVESRGGATVYRFSVESLRRAHDLGWTPEDILTTLQERSQTPLPQPLTYLIGDLDRPRVRPRPSPGPATTTH
ncbi:MAG: helicase-associated domain-containing protein, partial [Nocardioidaceae bacterium]